MKKKLTQEEFEKMCNNSMLTNNWRYNFSLNNLDLRDVKINAYWTCLIRCKFFKGTDLRGVDFSNVSLTETDLSGVILNGPEILSVTFFTNATIPARLLPWFAAHPRFAEACDSLTIVDDEVEDDELC